MDPLTEDEISSIQYWWEKREELDNVEHLMSRIKEHHPDLYKTYQDFKISKKIMNTIVKSLTF